jgi:carbonic anhydrase
LRFSNKFLTGFCQDEEVDIVEIDDAETIIKKNEGDHEKNYDFRSPVLWYLKYPLCLNGANQSPINIDKNLVKKSFAPAKLQASNWKVKPDEIKIMNREESVGFFPIYYSEEKVPVISGGCLGGKSYSLL